ncbi:hypothetical protein WJX72_001602 [[Myrmecia] bisecta]|uniref:Uncharacterized protein n=1 Tax=[Myrmecia] bisecta TaxID=41462 RepID=A0AAW1P9G8_9CHLO
MDWKAAVAWLQTRTNTPHCSLVIHPRLHAQLKSRGVRLFIPEENGKRRRVCSRRLCHAAAVQHISDEFPAQKKPLPKANCYGCGIQLQTDTPEAAGFVLPDKFALKHKHKQLDQLLCGRCHELSHGAMVAAVEDFTQRSSGAATINGRRLVTPEELRRQLAVVKDTRAIAVLLVDVLDASGSFLSRVRDFVGKNPVVLVGTKADLLPAGTDERDVLAWLLDTAAFKQLNTISTHLVSSRTGAGVSEAAAAILRERRGRDVFMLGAANVGKSAFVRALIQEMSRMTSVHFDPAAVGSSKHLPVESAMPGTTLSMIPLQTFASGGELYDTPGVHLHHRLPHMLTPEELQEVHPRRKLRPYVAPALQAHPASQRASLTYMWGALARFDVLDAPDGAQLVFYGPPAFKVHSLPLCGPADKPHLAPDAEEPLFGTPSVVARGGLRVAKEVTLQSTSAQAAVADIAISGMSGWAAVYLPAARASMTLRVWAPVGVEVYVRPALPVPNPIQGT